MKRGKKKIVRNSTPKCRKTFFVKNVFIVSEKIPRAQKCWKSRNSWDGDTVEIPQESLGWFTLSEAPASRIIFHFDAQQKRNFIHVRHMRSVNLANAISMRRSLDCIWWLCSSRIVQRAHKRRNYMKLTSISFEIGLISPSMFALCSSLEKLQFQWNSSLLRPWWPRGWSLAELMQKNFPFAFLAMLWNRRKSDIFITKKLSRFTPEN